MHLELNKLCTDIHIHIHTRQCSFFQESASTLPSVHFCIGNLTTSQARHINSSHRTPRSNILWPEIILSLTLNIRQPCPAEYLVCRVWSRDNCLVEVEALWTQAR